MRNSNRTDVVHKEVVIIGNGPSGIALSYMLSGNLPYLTSREHPDEMLTARLSSISEDCLIHADLGFLATGLEGRSTNPISILLDALLNPYADVGLEMESLVEFKKNGKEIDHIVLGKGPPGGSWHKMDPQILTLSLGSWMSLPGLQFNVRDSGEKRAYASSVANYYVQYVEEMGLKKYFMNNVMVNSVKFSSEISKEDSINWVQRIDENDRVCVDNEKNKCKKFLFTNAFNYILNRGNKNYRHCCKRPRDEQNAHEQSPDRKIREIEESDDRNVSTCHTSNTDSIAFDTYCLKNFNNETIITQVPSSTKSNWSVETFDLSTGKPTIYTCKYLVLANGCNDVPNKLTIRTKEPDWLLYDLRTLETCLDDDISRNSPRLDPVLVIGAGLSAADAVIAIRGRNVPVAHAFRNKSADLNRQLPENMYPEYHKVHQMMQDGGSSYPLYTSYPEYTLSEVNEKKRTVLLTPKEGLEIELKVSYVIVLIGSRPDLSFLPSDTNIAIKNNLPIDGKTNAVNIDKMTHRVKGYDNLYAIGTLAGDNFVRFIPGGALAVLADLYKRNKVDET